MLDAKQIYTILSYLFKSTDFTNVNDKGFVQVHCPFHQDNTKSAGIKPETGFFHCFTCNINYNLHQLFKKIYGISDEMNVNSLLQNITNYSDSGLIEKQHQALLDNIATLFKIQSLGINLDTIKALKLLDLNNGYEINIPVMIDGMLMGYVCYTTTPNVNQSKTYCSPGLNNGLIIPFDLWRIDKRPTLICEGEKDMLVARSNGFNAITLKGGCKALPRGWERYFVDREVNICYDNDTPGQEGAEQLAHYLYQNGCQKIKVITNYYEVIKAPKEDITDFFMKYQKDTYTLQTYIDNTPYWTQQDSQKVKEKLIPTISLDKCVEIKHLNQLRQSKIQVKAENVDTYSIPIKAIFYVENADGEEIEYQYDINEQSYGLVFNFMEGKINTKDFKMFFKECIVPLFKLNHDYKLTGVWFDSKHQPIYKTIISPYIESDSELDSCNVNGTMEIIAYSFKPLQTSQIYDIVYRARPNTFKRGVIQLIIQDIEYAQNSIDNYEVDEPTKKILDYFKLNANEEVDKALATKIESLYLNLKDNEINHLNFDLWLANELTFNSCLKFRLKNKLLRGTIYTNVIGDTRVGKSEIAEKLLNVYQQGKKINAKTSTVDSLIGGSDKRGNENFIKAGVFPRNHRSLIVLEELHGLGNAYFEKITEIKSSGRISIQRVSGELNLKCDIRLIEIANPVSYDTNVGAKSVNEFADGVSVIKSLIHNPEDIARNDIYLIIRKDKRINPYTTHIKPTPIPDHYYQTRLKWVWSRKPHHIRIMDERYLWKQADSLNKKFDCDSLSILGNEAYIKVGRMAVALAAMLCNSDETYEQVIVENYHIDYIVKWLDQLYSNEVMKIDKYVLNQLAYSECNEIDVQNLQRLYQEWDSAIEHLESQDETSKDMLIQMSGKSPNQTGPLFSELSINKFIRIQGLNKIVPTIKFRKAIKQINKHHTYQPPTKAIQF